MQPRLALSEAERGIALGKGEPRENPEKENIRAPTHGPW